jgi:hypothetical protein
MLSNKIDLKFVVAQIIDYKDLIKVVQKDCMECFTMSKALKHKNQKTIKRRNKKKETVYKEQYRKITFWEEIKYYKKNLVLFDFNKDLLKDEDIIDEAVFLVETMTSHRLKVFYDKNNRKVIFKKNNRKMNLECFLSNELKKKDEIKEKKIKRKIEKMEKKNDIEYRTNN